MKICVAQTRPVRGNIQANITAHLRLTELAASQGADIIIFPELSITGYEPAQAKPSAVNINDNRFAVFQNTSDAQNITIGIGVPVKTSEGITISLLLFQPTQERAVYSKQFLHPDEDPFFIRGQKNHLPINHLSLAICYELSVDEHAEAAFQKGAGIYLASVAKPAQGMEKAHERLMQIAKDYSMTVLVANSIGLQDGMECCGRSAVWNNNGEQLGQLDDQREGILLFDTATGEVYTEQV